MPIIHTAAAGLCLALTSVGCGAAELDRSDARELPTPSATLRPEVASVLQQPISMIFESSRPAPEISSCLAGVLPLRPSTAVEAVRIQGKMVFAEMIQSGPEPKVTRTTEIVEAGDRRAIKLRSAGLFQLRDGARVADAYRPCL